MASFFRDFLPSSLTAFTHPSEQDQVDAAPLRPPNYAAYPPPPTFIPHYPTSVYSQYARAYHAGDPKDNFVVDYLTTARDQQSYALDIHQRPRFLQTPPSALSPSAHSHSWLSTSFLQLGEKLGFSSLSMTSVNGNGALAKTSSKPTIPSKPSPNIGPSISERALRDLQLKLITLLVILATFLSYGLLYMTYFTLCVLCTLSLVLLYMFAEDSTVTMISRELERGEGIFSEKLTKALEESTLKTNLGVIEKEKPATTSSSLPESAEAALPPGTRRLRCLRRVRQYLETIKNFRNSQDELLQVLIGLLVLISLFVPADSPINSTTIHYPFLFLLASLLCPIAVLSYAASAREASLLRHAGRFRRQTVYGGDSKEVLELTEEIQRLLVERDFFKSSKVSYFASFFPSLMWWRGKSAPAEKEEMIHSVFRDARSKDPDLLNALIHSCDLE